MEKKYKRLWIATISGLAGCLVLIAGYVIVLDPFYSYHMPLFGWEAQNWDETYCNPGLMRHLEYDSALVGTSMTEQFRASEASQVMGGTYIKIKRSGGTSLDIARMIEALREANPEMKNIILGMDINILRKSSNEYRSEMPEYIWDRNYLNDVSYWYNQDVLFKFSYALYSNNKNGTIMSLDDSFIIPPEKYGKEIALQEYSRPKEKDQSDKEAEWLEKGRANLDNILSAIAGEPEIHYDVFIPPYSILYWDQRVRTNTLEAEYALQEDMLKRLFACPNVTVHYFMDCEEIITDLENYKDAGHYDSAVSSELLNYMKSGEKIVTEENYVQVLDAWFSYVQSHDYEQYFAEE